jgi:hypothetical protein
MISAVFIQRKGNHTMFTFIAQSGSITTGLDLTTDLSSLLVSLVTVLVLSAGRIAFEAVRYHLAQKAQVPTEMVPAIIEYQQAA